MGALLSNVWPHQGAACWPIPFDRFLNRCIQCLLHLLTVELGALQRAAQAKLRSVRQHRKQLGCLARLQTHRFFGQGELGEGEPWVQLVGATPARLTPGTARAAVGQDPPTSPAIAALGRRG